jgi:hypothetical protein
MEWGSRGSMPRDEAPVAACDGSSVVVVCAARQTQSNRCEHGWYTVHYQITMPRMPARLRSTHNRCDVMHHITCILAAGQLHTQPIARAWLHQLSHHWMHTRCAVAAAAVCTAKHSTFTGCIWCAAIVASGARQCDAFVTAAGPACTWTGARP